TGGFIEYVLTQGPEAVRLYLQACRELGFDIVEVSSGFVAVPGDDLVRLVGKVEEAGVKAKPGGGIQFGAVGGPRAGRGGGGGGARPAGARSGAPRRYREAGAPLIRMEWEGITENVRHGRTDVPAKIIDARGLERVMFEAADPPVFDWYVKNYGPEVNLF